MPEATGAVVSSARDGASTCALAIDLARFWIQPALRLQLLRNVFGKVQSRLTPRCGPTHRRNCAALIHSMAAIRVVDLKASTSAATSPDLLVDADTGRSALKRATLCIVIAGALGTPAAKRLLRLRAGGILHLA